MTLIFPWKYAKACCTWPQGTSSIQGATLPVCTISELLLGRTSCWELPGIPNSSPTEPNKRHRPHRKHIITHTRTLTSLRLFAPTCSFLDLKNVELVIFFYSSFTFLTPHILLLVFLSCLQMFLCTCHADSAEKQAMLIPSIYWKQIQIWVHSWSAAPIVTINKRRAGFESMLGIWLISTKSCTIVSRKGLHYVIEEKPVSQICKWNNKKPFYFCILFQKSALCFLRMYIPMSLWLLRGRVMSMQVGKTIREH